jgi:hypothetical protein
LSKKSLELLSIAHERKVTRIIDKFKSRMLEFTNLKGLNLSTTRFIFEWNEKFRANLLINNNQFNSLTV